MIQVAKLEKMVQAEFAADTWWRSLSPRERKAYLKAHPNSKYARAMTKTARDAHSGAEDVTGPNAGHQGYHDYRLPKEGDDPKNIVDNDLTKHLGFKNGAHRSNRNWFRD